MPGIADFVCEKTFTHVAAQKQGYMRLHTSSPPGAAYEVKMSDGEDALVLPRPSGGAAFDTGTEKSNEPVLRWCLP